MNFIPGVGVGNALNAVSATCLIALFKFTDADVCADFDHLYLHFYRTIPLVLVGNWRSIFLRNSLFYPYLFTAVIMRRGYLFIFEYDPV